MTRFLFLLLCCGILSPSAYAVDCRLSSNNLVTCLKDDTSCAETYDGDVFCGAQASTCMRGLLGRAVCGALATDCVKNRCGDRVCGGLVTEARKAQLQKEDENANIPLGQSYINSLCQDTLGQVSDKYFEDSLKISKEELDNLTNGTDDMEQPSMNQTQENLRVPNND